jgi:ligand-binding SRPBCC domain-containing protein
MNFSYSSLINAPVEAVWRFYEREDILQILTPPWQPLEIVRREGGLGVGAVSEFRIWLGIFPVTWIARHSECEPYRYFVDRQEVGPLAFWVHRHEFDAGSGGTTRLTDSIEYRVTENEIVNSGLSGWVNARLHDMFRYRHEATRRELER